MTAEVLKRRVTGSNYRRSVVRGEEGKKGGREGMRRRKKRRESLHCLRGGKETKASPQHDNNIMPYFCAPPLLPPPTSPPVRTSASPLTCSLIVGAQPVTVFVN